MTVEVRILGRLEVLDGGVPLLLGGTRQRAVLAMLVLHVNRVVSTDFLVDGLWGEQPPVSAVNVVQAYVSRLRKVLLAARPAVEIVRRRPGYLLDVVDPGIVDLCRFDELAREGVAALPAAPERAATLLRAALALCHGSALGEFTDQPFAQAEGRRLREQRLAVLAARVDADLALGRHRELVGEITALLAEYPLHEGLHGQLILSLYRSGRQAEALEAHRRARDLLSEQLGVDPGSALQDLERAILAHDDRLEWHPPATNGADSGGAEQDQSSRGRSGADSTPPKVWNAPARNPYFTGHEDLLTALHDRLRSGGETLVVQALYGLGGVGKTQLAIEFAHRYAADYDLVWWIDAEQPVLIPDQLIRLADRLNLPTSGDTANLVQRVLAELSRRPGWLLIFDNAEHPQDIAAYRPSGPGQVIATSRYPAWGALGGRLEVDVLTRSETVALLRARIPEMTPATAQELADELGDLPLAAAQAAAYLEQTGLPPIDYLRRFRARRAALLASGDVLGYQGRVDTTWDLALERLRIDNPASVTILELAAFLGPEPIPLTLFTDHPDVLNESAHAAAAADRSVAAVRIDTDGVNDAVGAAVRFSLIRRNPDSIQVHRLVQAVIRERLPAVRHRILTDQVMALLAAAGPGDPNDPENWAAYAHLAPHVVAASRWGDDHPGGRQIMLATTCYLLHRGETNSSRRIVEELHQRWQQQLGADHPDTLSALANHVQALVGLVDQERVRTLGKDALRRAWRVLGPDHPVTLRLATSLTFALAGLGQAQQASALGQDTLDRARRVLGPESPDTLYLAANLVFALIWQDDTDRAITLGEDTLISARKAMGHDHPVTLLTAAYLALAHGWLGDADTARAIGQSTLVSARKALGPDHQTTLLTAAHLSFVLARLGEPEQAAALGEDTLTRARATLGADNLITLSSAAGLAFVQAGLGKLLQARALAEETLTSSRRDLGPDHPLTLIAASALTTAMNGLGNFDEARALAEDTLSRSRQVLGDHHPITLAMSLQLNNTQTASDQTRN